MPIFCRSKNRSKKRTRIVPNRSRLPNFGTICLKSHFHAMWGIFSRSKDCSKNRSNRFFWNGQPISGILGHFGKTTI